jgi:Domain of unknown function (DUF2019)
MAMKRTKLHEMTVAHLVDRFIAVALDEDKAMLDTAKFNRLFWELDAVNEELKSRPGDQRRALLPLLDHSNAQVRLQSAIATLAVAPEAARQALQIISDRQEYPQAADARGMMRALDNRTYIPS